MQIEFVYLIRTSGIEADDILRGMEITLGGDLIIATTILVKNILQEDPAGGDRRMQNKRVRGKASLVKTTVASGQDSVPYHGLKSTKKNDSGRYLASYYKDSPVILNDVFDLSRCRIKMRGNNFLFYFFFVVLTQKINYFVMLHNLNS